MCIMSLYYFYLFITIYCYMGIVNGDGESIQCKDETGEIVDWYVMYKIPKVKESSDPLIRKGTKYLYITNKTIYDGWKLSDKGIDSKNSIPGNTLATIYKDDLASKLMWIMYNDQPPNKSTNSKYGHAKGIVMTDKNRGFWLIHSVPSYPPIPRTGMEKKSYKRRENATIENDIDGNNLSNGEYDYPQSAMHYGQSFLCISLNANQMNNIGLQLMYNQIISYRFNLPRILSMQFPGLVNASRRARIKNPPYNHRSELQSTDGRQFISFAKSDKWQKDLYDDFVAPKLQTDLLAETWLNGPGKLPSECNSSKVLNVQSILLDVANINFKSSHDHSKWAVATSNKNNHNWVCIGDINRANTQFNRGGGTVCINLLELWNNYRKSVSEIEPCPKNGILKRIYSWIHSKIS